MLKLRKLNLLLMLALVAGTIAFGLARSGPAAGQDADVQAKIDSAMSAAPASISANATILDNALDANGKFVVLREGTNGWFCQPDIVTSPGNDPACYDQTWMDWNYAFVAGQDPTPAVPGIAYMLQGGSDPSNTDPLLTEPPAGEEWVSTPPHIMVVFPDPIDQTVYTTDHHSGGPYIMWAGTPYEHIMVPVAEGEGM